MITGKEPVNVVHHLETGAYDSGMTLKQKFAESAMRGYCGVVSSSSFEDIARDSVRQANALIAALNEDEVKK